MGPIDITGLDWEMVSAFFVSRYFQSATIQEHMASAHPGADDPFEGLAEMRQVLESAAGKLRGDQPELDRNGVLLALLGAVNRSD